MSGDLIAKLADRRLSDPVGYARRVLEREPTTWKPNEPLMLIAADHPARGSLGAGDDPNAMGNREELLQRCVIALQRPGVNGFVGTCDMVADLANLGVLDRKLVFGSMNRGGIAGSSFELDDTMTGYDVSGIISDRLNGGKMLLRYDLSDPGTRSTMLACAAAITELGRAHRLAMVEPIMCHREDTGQISNDFSVDAMIKTVAITAGLGSSTAWTWLKLPAIWDMATVANSTTMPILLLGGEPPEDIQTAHQIWKQALRPRNIRGVVFGRSVLYPRNGDIGSTCDAIYELLKGKYV